MGKFLYKLTVIRQFVKSRAFSGIILFLGLSAVMLTIFVNTNAVYINDDGQRTMFFTMKKTSEDILKEQEIFPSEHDEVLFSGFEDKVANITINRAFPVNVSVDGTSTTVFVTKGTVSDVLAKANVEVFEDDTMNLSLEANLSGPAEISINRVDYITETKEYAIPRETNYIDTPLLKSGRTKVLSAGADGLRSETIKHRVVDGKIVESTLVENKVVHNPITKQVLRGSKTTPVSPLDAFKGFELNENGVPKKYKDIIWKADCTAYSARPGAGTASGRKAVVGHVAVNPKYIPYGTKLYITSADGSFVYGYAIAADTGTALSQELIDIDLFFGSYIESCLFGRRNLRVYILE